MGEEPPAREPTQLERAASSSLGAVLVVLAVTPLDVVKTRMQSVGVGGSGSGGGTASSKVRCRRTDFSFIFFARPVLIRPSLLFISQMDRPWGGAGHAKGTQPQLFSALRGGAQLPSLTLGHRCLSCGASVLTKGRATHICAPLSHTLPAQSSTLRGLQKIYRGEGIGGLYRGVGPTLLMAVPATVLYYSMYDEMRSRILLGGVDSAIAPMAAGGLSRSFVAVVGSPLELVRTRMQATPAGAELSSWSSILKEEVKSGGMRALWRGLGPTLWRDVPFSVVYWAAYDAASRKLRGDQKTQKSAFGTAFVAGAGAGAIATAFTHPFDVVKTRRQVGMLGDHGRSLDALRMIYKVEGVKGMYVGLSARIAKVAPSCALMIGVYEAGKHFFTQL
jgi:solute carrier family 25 protein 39/40